MSRKPWRLRARLGLGLAVAGPALAIGGVWPGVVPVFAGLVALMLHEVHRRGRPLRSPAGLGLGLLAFGATLVQALPLPGVRALLSPGLHEWIELSRAGLPGDGWPSLSPAPADTVFEAVRLLALCGLALLCAQRSWRSIAGLVALTGVLVAGIGLVQHGLGLERIYGLHAPVHLPPGRLSSPLLTTFVNPNHQSGLLLLGLFAAAGLMVANQAEDRRLEPRVVLSVAVVLQVTALVLSMSRAALLAAVAAGLPALLVAWWPESRDRPPVGWASRLLGLATLLGIAVGLGTLGAWHELGPLVEPSALDHATADRVRIDASAPALLSLAPVTGIGRGAFGDVFPAFDPGGSHVWFSHLECAPLAMLLEWGPLVGGALVVGLPLWWVGSMRRAGGHGDARARRVVLLGLAALALQGLADFSLEFLGVAAPACALAGSLSPVGSARLAPRRVRALSLGLAGLAVAVAPLLPHTWAADTIRVRASLSLRPLAAPRHRAQARAALGDERWDDALARARAAVRLMPGHVDGWLLLAAAHGGRGERADTDRALAQALGLLHAPASTALVDDLVRLYPDPAALARLTPVARDPWRHLAEGLRGPAPAHADAVAAVWSARHPGDPESLRIRVETSLALARPGLALHHARLWRQRRPADARSHLAVARALQAQPQPRPEALREALERALVEADLHDLHLRGLVEEQLLRALLREEPPVDPARVIALAAALRSRPGDDAVQERRRVLCRSALVMADELRLAPRTSR